MIAAWIIAETGVVNSVLGFFSRGGLFMWPLLACSIVSVTIKSGAALAHRTTRSFVAGADQSRGAATFARTTF